jgi:hypothetical protein
VLPQYPKSRGVGTRAALRGGPGSHAILAARAQSGKDPPIGNGLLRGQARAKKRSPWRPQHVLTAQSAFADS